MISAFCSLPVLFREATESSPTFRPQTCPPRNDPSFNICYYHYFYESAQKTGFSHKSLPVRGLRAEYATLSQKIVCGPEEVIKDLCQPGDLAGSMTA